eukprot:6572565-Pyramimonas_sp.AAC.1
MEGAITLSRQLCAPGGGEGVHFITLKNVVLLTYGMQDAVAKLAWSRVLIQARVCSNGVRPGHSGSSTLGQFHSSACKGLAML